MVTFKEIHNGHQDGHQSIQYLKLTELMNM